MHGCQRCSYENSTVMMVREAWRISVQMRGNLCTRCFLASKDLWLSKKRKKKRKKDHSGLTSAHLHMNNQCVGLFSCTEVIGVSKTSAGF